MSNSNVDSYNPKLSISGQTKSPVIEGFESLSEIIKEIQEGTYEEDVNKIRAILNNTDLSDDEKEEQSKEIKNELLGLFYPCVYLPDYKALDNNKYWKATGIIQFDIDHITVEKAHELKTVISGYGDCIYAFMSPRYGLKFAMYTDYKADSKESFAVAYMYASTIIQDRLNIKLDDSMKSINQACYMSWDTEAFFNENVSKLIINESVLKLLIDTNTKEKQAQLINENTSLSKAYEGTTAEEIVNALSYIDKDLKFKDREAINFAVIDGLGTFEAKTVLMNHWMKSDKKELEKQIDGYCNSFKKGQGITVATLFYHAKKNGYHKKTQLKLNNTNKEASFNEVRYSPKEAVLKLVASIDDFIDTKQSKIINFEAGAGKSSQLRETIFNKIIIGGLARKVAIYVRSHETAEEYKVHFEELASRNDHLEDFRSKRDAESDKFKLKLKVQHIKGRYQVIDGEIDDNSYCKHELLTSNDPDDKGLFDKYAAKFCGVCKLQEKCGYVEQFNSSDFYRQQVRIYTHQSLFTEPSLWNGGSYYGEGDEFSISADIFDADYLIIDEDILGSVFNANNIEVSSNQDSCRSIDSILYDVKHESITIEQAIIKHEDLVKVDFESQKKLMMENDKEDKNIHFSGSIRAVKKSVRNLKTKDVHYKEILKEMLLFIDASDANNGRELKHNGIQYNENKKTLMLFKTAKIKNRLLSKPILILDASADKNLWEVVSDKVFNKQFNFEQIRVNYSENISVYQYASKSYSRFYLQSILDIDEGLDKLVETILEVSKDKKIGLITYQNLKGCKDFHEYLGNKVHAVVSGYFGNVRGLNSFNDTKIDQLFIVGRHSIGQGIENQYRQLFNDITENIEGQEFIRADKEEVFRLKNGKNKSITREHYHNEMLVALDNHFNKGETYQAAHRLRLIHSDRKKELFIFTNEVLDLTLDAVILNETIGERIISKMEKVIENEGFIINTNKEIANSIEMKSTQIRDNRALINDHFQGREATELGGYRDKTVINKYIK